MTEVANELSNAVVLYLGYGKAKSPQSNGQAVIAEFGVALLANVHKLMAELGAIGTDWSNHDLQSAGKMARAEMKNRHPQLSDQALDALEWKFTFDWR